MNFKLAAFADESDNILEGQISALKRNDFKYLEIRNVNGKNFTELSECEAKEIKKKLADNGLSVISLGSPIGKIDINGDFEAHLELYKRTLELGNIFGASKIRLFSFFISENEEPDAYKNLVIDRMGSFGDIAKEFNITPCHENEKGIYGDTAERCLEIFKAVPEIKCVFDPANFVQCGVDTLKAWEILNPYIDYMHIKDANISGAVVPPGKGIGNVPQLLNLYAQNGGELLTLEPHLYEFIGLQNLEREGDKSIVGEMAFESAEAAFDFAAKTLKEMVKDL